MSRRAPLRNPLTMAGVAMSVLLVGLAGIAPFVAPRDPLTMQAAQSLQAPSPAHLLGTDRFGRDVLSRVIYGSRVSLWIGFASVAGALVGGVMLGVLSGYYGRWPDLAVSRLMDVLFSVPTLLLAIAIAAVRGPGTANAILAIAVVYSPVFGRVVRAVVLAERERTYVEAARAIGAAERRILGRHVMPNVVSPLTVQATLSLSHAILLEAYLSFLGLGIRPPHPSWGAMLAEGRSVLELAPWLSVFPGAAIMLSVLAFNLVGDGLRDILDPRLHGT